MTDQFRMEILQRIDCVEAEMRRLENRLTHIREALHKEWGLTRTCNEAGVSRKELARRAADTSEVII